LGPWPSWNLVSGLTGYVSFGHVAFFGTGAYATAILVASRGWPWAAAALAGGVAAVVLAVLIGYPCLRLKGPYFAISMLGLNEVMRVLVSYFEGLTGGGMGLSLPVLQASVSIYRDGPRGGGDRGHPPDRHLPLRAAAHDHPRGRVAAEAMGIDTLRLQALRLPALRGGSGIVGGLSRATRATSSRSPGVSARS
jgi:hypothetical protein